MSDNLNKQDPNLQDQGSQNDENLDQNELEANTDESDLATELAQAKENLIRAQADFENIKKRLEKDKITAVSFANESFARDLLPVIDALEMAAKVEVSAEETKLLEGVNLTISEFNRCLEKHGVKAIQAEIGGEFNPEIHNAMSQIESEIESGKIAQIYQKGYLYNDRILRPTMVLIAK